MFACPFFPHSISPTNSLSPKLSESAEWNGSDSGNDSDSDSDDDDEDGSGSGSDDSDGAEEDGLAPEEDTPMAGVELANLKLSDAEQALLDAAKEEAAVSFGFEVLLEH